MSVIEALQNNGFATIDYVVFAAYIVLLVGLLTLTPLLAQKRYSLIIRDF